MKVVAFDFDGVLAQTFNGSDFVSYMKSLFAERVEILYPLAQFVEMALGIRRILHAGSVECIQRARRAGMLTGIITDRNLVSLIRATGLNGLDLSLVDFLNVRVGVSSPFVRLHGHISVCTSERSKFSDLLLSEMGIEDGCTDDRRSE